MPERDLGILTVNLELLKFSVQQSKGRCHCMPLWHLSRSTHQCISWVRRSQHCCRG